MPQKDQLETGAYSEDEKQQIREAIRKKYRDVAVSADNKFNYKTGRTGAETLGYDRTILDTLEDEVLSSFCGVGNPFSMGEPDSGSSVLDIGCGAGIDLVFARKMAGDGGRVCGVDLTEDMIRRAQLNFQQLDMTNIEVTHIQSEDLPFEDSTFDLVISNGVINLSPAKPELFAEIYRVLKPEGRLQFADIMLEGELPSQMAGSLEAWTQ